AEHRIYNTGEPTRHIDWKLFGRTEKLFVKRYEEETNLRCQIIIDASSSMFYPEMAKNKPEILNKINFSVYSAASIMHLLKKQRDAVGLSIFSESVNTHTPAKSSSVHHKLLYLEMEKLLRKNEITSTTNAADSLHEIAENIHKRSLVIIFSDMMDNSSNSEELFSALQHMKHNKHEVILFHVTDKAKEQDFDFENRPYLFVDMETGEEVKVSSNDIKPAYVEAMNNYKQELKLKCGQFNIDFVEADINEGYKQVLQPYLIKRSKMI
ncbi:MAG: DUF58 domain-containing protein, partial [Chitinophagaceae bacterium]|nr:DUF58 domain-containing protein [Chitinophagaceae bacterium]